MKPMPIGREAPLLGQFVFFSSSSSHMISYADPSLFSPIWETIGQDTGGEWLSLMRRQGARVQSQFMSRARESERRLDLSVVLPGCAVQGSHLAFVYF